MRSILVALAATLLCASAVALAPLQPDPIHRVETFIRAFNAHDAPAMGTMVAEDVQWLLVDGDKITVESAGRDALLKSMASYFESCPSCRSELASISVAGSRVTALEVARWDGKDGPRQQRSLSVYEFKDTLIARVYYFPAES